MSPSGRVPANVATVSMLAALSSAWSMLSDSYGAYVHAGSSPPDAASHARPRFARSR